MPRAPTAAGSNIRNVIEIRGLHKAFGERTVLKDLGLDVAKGELCVLIGRSGSGKSTLLRCLNGLEAPDSGSIQTHGVIGMVFQNFHLFPHLNLRDNIMAAPRHVKGMSFDDAHALATRLLAKVGLAEHASHFPSQLSGGQQQRGAIARALAMSPEILLYDEPTASLDPHLTGEVMDVMKSLKREGMTQVMVTHEHAFARKAADRAVFIEAGQVVETASARRLFSAPQDPRTRRFLKGLR